MNHRNVVQVQEVLEHQDTDVIVMEFVDGFSLSRIVQEKTALLSVRLHLGILLQMLTGLHHFHELSDLDGHPLEGVHRDVSPHNVLVSYDGQAKVSDFGIAKINAPVQFATQTGLVKGKIHYMAPEQIVADEVDRRTDVFAAGVLLWEALAQRRMWSGLGAPQVMRALTEGRIPELDSVAPSIPGALRDVANRATKSDPRERYESALEMLEAMERAMAETTGIAPQREISEFMASAFGEIRAIRQQSVNHALRHPELAPLGILDCWTAGYAAQQRRPSAVSRKPLQLDSPIGLGDELADLSLPLDTASSPDATVFAALPQGTGVTSTAMETARINEPARGMRKSVIWLAVAAAVASSAAWLYPLGSHQRAKVAAGHAARVEASAEASAPPPPAVSSAVIGSRQAVEDRREEEPVSPDDLDRDDEPRAVHAAPSWPPSHGRRSAPPKTASSVAPDCSPPYRILANGFKRFKVECFPNGSPEKP